MMVFTNKAILVYFKEEENQTLENHFRKAARKKKKKKRIKVTSLGERNKNLGFVRNNVPFPNTVKSIKIGEKKSFWVFASTGHLFSLPFLNLAFCFFKYQIQ